MTEDAVRNLDCFIIMPFVKAEVKGINLDEIKLTYIYENFFCKAIKSYNKNNISFANVSRYDSSRGNFIKGIVGKLNNADLVLADLSGLNPNVFYELGIRHTLKNGTILLTQDISSLPADLKNYIAFEYEYPDASNIEECYKEFEENMHTAIDEFVADMDKPDNPVKDFLGVKHIIRDEQRKREILTNIDLFKILQGKYINIIINLILSLFKWEKDIDVPTIFVSLGIQPILNRMVILGESAELINFLQNLSSSQEVNNSNKSIVKRKVKKEKSINSPRDLYYGFTGKNNKYYHVLDLMTYYKFSENEVEVVGRDPIVTSFDYFIQQWEDELNEINS